MTHYGTRLSCDEVEELLPLVIDGVITEADEPDLFCHLAECPQCQASLATHDLITFALAPKQPLHMPAKNHGHYPLRLSWLAAAAGIIAMGATGILWLGSSPQSAQTLSAQEHTGSSSRMSSESNDLEVVQILRPGPGREQPLFVVRENGRIVVLPSEDLDGGHYRSTLDHPAPLPDQPRHIRASDVRHIGHFD
ncbi:MAG: zf-HC2 domain-containing protein [Planctomycetota bacterium]|nr:MAG: zf-HC2 domain-containing protein [Planctomycetota bacterium]